MELTLEQYKRVQQYLDERMTPGEAESFMEEVSANAALQEYLQFEIELRENLVALKELSKNKIAQPVSLPPMPRLLKDKMGGKETISIKTVIAIAACLIVVVAAILWFLSERSHNPELAKKNSADSGKGGHVVQQVPDTSQPEINTTALYKQFYAKEKSPEEKPDLIAQALIEYDNGKYKMLQELNPSTRGSMGTEEDQTIMELTHYYKGLSFMETGNFKRAADNLDWVIRHGKNKQLVLKARWYLALIDVNQNKINEAIAKLNFLSATRFIYSGKSDSLLHALK